ncbi:hypothetical protein NJBCHELONAE_48740 [Mycobacteroides chelonae]|nr:hypothetical protein NJBCHELONAE_48740 [Mycobacteroides chelonae]
MERNADLRKSRDKLQETRDNTRDELAKSGVFASGALFRRWGLPESTPEMAKQVVDAYRQLQSDRQAVDKANRETHQKQLDKLNTALNGGGTVWFAAPGSYTIDGIYGGFSARQLLGIGVPHVPNIVPEPRITFEQVEQRAKGIVKQLSDEKAAHIATRKKLRKAQTLLQQHEFNEWYRQLPTLREAGEDCPKCGRSAKPELIVGARNDFADHDAVKPTHLRWYSKCGHSWETKTADSEAAG